MKPLLVFLAAIFLLTISACDNDSEPTALEGKWSFTSSGSTPQVTSSFKISKGSTYQLSDIVVNQQTWNYSEVHGPSDVGFEVLTLKIAKTDMPAMAFAGCKLSEDKKQMHVDSVLFFQALNPKPTATYYNQVLIKN